MTRSCVVVPFRSVRQGVPLLQLPPTSLDDDAERLLEEAGEAARRATRLLERASFVHARIAVDSTEYR